MNEVEAQPLTPNLFWIRRPDDAESTGTVPTRELFREVFAHSCALQSVGRATSDVQGGSHDTHVPIRREVLCSPVVGARGCTRPSLRREGSRAQGGMCVQISAGQRSPRRVRASAPWKGSLPAFPSCHIQYARARGRAPDDTAPCLSANCIFDLERNVIKMCRLLTWVCLRIGTDTHTRPTLKYGLPARNPCVDWVLIIVHVEHNHRTSFDRWMNTLACVIDGSLRARAYLLCLATGSGVHPTTGRKQSRHHARWEGRN